MLNNLLIINDIIDKSKKFNTLDLLFLKSFGFNYNNTLFFDSNKFEYYIIFKYIIIKKQCIIIIKSKTF